MVIFQKEYCISKFFGWDVLWSGACARTTKHSVCHGNKVDYSFQSLRSVAKYRSVYCGYLERMTDDNMCIK